MAFFGQFFANTGLATLGIFNLLMVMVGLALMFLGIAKRYESLLLTALGFGVVVGNMAFGARPALTADGDILRFFTYLVASGILPALIFLGIGVLTDFSSLIAQPRLALLAGAAQAGVFVTVVLATVLGFAPSTAAALAMGGGAYGPAAIYAAALLDPRVLGSVAIAAYVLMALAPVIQPPILRLLTTRRERQIQMAPPRRVSRRMRILFPIFGFILGSFVVPRAASLLGMLFLGNLLRECGVTEHLSKSMSKALRDLVTLLLAFSVGLLTTGTQFLTFRTLGVFVFGAVAFVLSTAGGVLFARLMNIFSRQPVNPLLGGAGVAATSITARISQRVAHEDDPENHLLRQAMAPNLAGIIALALTAGMLITHLG